LREITFFDKRVWPNSLHQIVFRDNLPAMLNQRYENVEDLRSERNQLTLTQQDALRDFEAETTEFVTLIVLLIH
jgi:hypothetical protein